MTKAAELAKYQVALKTALIEFTDGDDAIAVADAGVVTLLTTAVAKSENGAVTHNIAQGLAKCWIKFNLSGTIAINDSFNASGITDNAVGKYDVAIGNNMNSVDYSVTSSAAFDDGGIGSDISCCRPDATTGYDGSNNLGSNGSARDAQYNSSTTHGDLA